MLYYFIWTLHHLHIFTLLSISSFTEFSHLHTCSPKTLLLTYERPTDLLLVGGAHDTPFGRVLATCRTHTFGVTYVVSFICGLACGILYYLSPAFVFHFTSHSFPTYSLREEHTAGSFLSTFPAFPLPAPPLYLLTLSLLPPPLCFVLFLSAFVLPVS